MAECTHLVRLTLLIVVDDKAEFTSRVLLAVLELAVDFDLVSLCMKVRNHDVSEFNREIRTTWLELADLGDVLRIGRGARLVKLGGDEERELSAYESLLAPSVNPSWVKAFSYQE